MLNKTAVLIIGKEKILKLWNGYFVYVNSSWSRPRNFCSDDFNLGATQPFRVAFVSAAEICPENQFTGHKA